MATTFAEQGFLDLEFNNHWVSEYGLIVVNDGSRYSETLFPEIINTTTNIPGKDGIVYWGTTKGGRVVTKKLATDGMTSRQLANFKLYFKSGIHAPLRMAESAYMYGYAILDSAPVFNFIPFATTIDINGTSFTDILYKGECEIVFLYTEAVRYSDYYLSLIDNSSNDFRSKDWFIESGLPLASWLASEGGIIQLALGNWYDADYSNSKAYSEGEHVLYEGVLYIALGSTEGNLPTDTDYWEVYSYNTTSLKCYHAGNSLARVNLSFKKTYLGTFSTDETFLTALWPAGNYVINSGILTEPRLIRDIRYTYEAILAHASTWVNDKPEVLIDLNENLDSTGAGVLRQLVNAAVAVEDIDTLKSRIISTFIAGKTYIISINAREKQVRMVSASSLENPLFDPAESFDIDDNITDSFNNNYIILPGTTGVNPTTGLLTYSTISSNISLIEPEAYFQNTYE